MIRVYADLDCGARCITFKDEQPPAQLELVRAFRDEERDAAWALLHELGRLFTRTPRPAGPNRGWLAPVSGRVRRVQEACAARSSGIDGRRHGS